MRGEVHGLQGKRFRERRALPMGHDGVLLEGTQRGALCALQSDLDSGTEEVGAVTTRLQPSGNYVSETDPFEA